MERNDLELRNFLSNYQYIFYCINNSENYSELKNNSYSKAIKELATVILIESYSKIRDKLIIFSKGTDNKDGYINLRNAIKENIDNFDNNDFFDKPSISLYYNKESFIDLNNFLTIK